MSGKVVSCPPTTPFEFELVESDSDQLSTVVASSAQRMPWIEPAKVKLRHRIGRGPFGDVWLATLHQATEDYEEYHEVALKMLHPLKEDQISLVLNRLGDVFSKCQELGSVCRLEGASIISGKLCLVMKFYEGSIGDKMARVQCGKLSLQDFLRYGAALAQQILELHSKEILVLNLKPHNFLLDEKDHAIIGDIGIPYILLAVPLPGSDVAGRLGTPNYMAPEQWQPEVRGPVTFEADSWGFACSIVEMLTGVQPWSGKSVDEIYNSVVKRQQRPCLPGGLPPAIENVMVGCFEYDFRNRPLMKDILSAFKSSQIAVSSDEFWMDTESRIVSENPGGSRYSEWLVLKDHLQVGDKVRSRKLQNSCKPENMEVSEGTIVGLESHGDANGSALVRVHGRHDPVRVHVSTLERVTFGLAPGNWVRLKAESKKHSPVGILHSIDRDGSVTVGFIGIEMLWKGSYSDLQTAETLCVGQFVKLRSSVFSPRFEWPRKRGGEPATGRICQVLPNGCLVVKFPGRLPFGDGKGTFLADPAEVEVVSFKTSPTLLKKYQHLEDFHWAVRPLLLALGIFTAMKLGRFVGKRIGRSKIKKGRGQVTPGDGPNVDGQAAGNAAWLHPDLASIIFREGASTSPSG